MDVCILDSKRLLDVEQKFKLAGVIALNVSKDGKDSGSKMHSSYMH